MADGIGFGAWKKPAQGRGDLGDCRGALGRRVLRWGRGAGPVHAFDLLDKERAVVVLLLNFAGEKIGTV